MAPRPSLPGTKPDLEILELIARGMGVEVSEDGARPIAGAPPGLVRSAGDTRFSSGSLGRYCRVLGSLAPGAVDQWADEGVRRGPGGPPHKMP